MKSRLSNFLVSGIIILSIFACAFIWRNKHLNETPNFNNKSFTAPVSSVYIASNADIVFHWKLDPTILPKYVENFQDRNNKNNINKKVKLIRDSSLNLISLDFAKDISKWAGDYGSFAVFNTKEKLFNDWLMILEINKDKFSNTELEALLETQVTYEEIESSNESKTSNLKIFSKKINPRKTIYFSREKEHILISSSQEIILSSIQQLGNNTLSRNENYNNIKLRDNIMDGFLLLEMSPKKILNSLEQEKFLLNLDHTDKLISSINIDKNKLIIEGILSYDIKKYRPLIDLSYDLINNNEDFKLFDDYILINNPKKFFGNESNHPYENLVASFIKEATNEDYSNFFKIILKNTKGNLIWLKDNDWLILTKKSDTSKKKINDLLKKDNFLNSYLEFNNKSLEVWSKITTITNDEYALKDNIEAIFQENEDTYLWSESLSSISNFEIAKYFPKKLNSEYNKNELKNFDDLATIHLGKEKTEVFLNNFYPYILLKMFLGNKLNSPQNIDISFAIPAINYADFIKFKINLKTS